MSVRPSVRMYQRGSYWSLCRGDLLHKFIEKLQILLKSDKIIGHDIQSDTKKRELLKNPTKIEEIQEKNLLTEIGPLQLAF